MKLSHLCFSCKPMKATKGQKINNCPAMVAAAPRFGYLPMRITCMEAVPKMPSYVMKILVDLEARDDLDARQRAAAMVGKLSSSLDGIREIVLHSQTDHKSIRLGLDGSFTGQWNKGGPSALPGEARSS